jgi:putative transcriptional regulator
MPIDPEYQRECEREDQALLALEPIDVRALRGRMRMTRAEFARRFGFPVETVRHWERGDRTPRRAALVLLNLIERNSQVALRLLRKRPR